MSFIFAETQGMQSAAASTAGLADDTANAGGQAGDSVVVPNPLWDDYSLANAVKMNQYASQAATQLQTGAGLQVNYGQSISNAAHGYVLADSTGAAGISSATGLTT
jgi:hypothetical protein